jgi:hypothetical protein
VQAQLLQLVLVDLAVLSVQVQLLAATQATLVDTLSLATFTLFVECPALQETVEAVR